MHVSAAVEADFIGQFVGLAVSAFLELIPNKVCHWTVLLSDNSLVSLELD